MTERKIPKVVPDDITMGPGKDGGMGFGEFAALVGEKLAADHETIDGRMRANEDAEAKRHEANAIYLIVTNEVFRVGGQLRKRTMVKTIEELPFVGHLQAFGRNYDVAVTNLRLTYATKLNQMKLIDSWDDCRTHAARIQFRPSLADVKG